MRDVGDSFDLLLSWKERALEEAFFANREEALLARLRGAPASDSTPHRCPECGATLAARREHGVAFEQCPSGHGLWVDETEIPLLADRTRDAWLDRYLYRPRLGG